MLPQYLDALFYSFMVGAGEAYFSAYALHLGFSELQSGLLATVPIVIGGFLQLLAPWGINKVKSFTKWTIIAVFLQSLIFLKLIFFDHLVRTNFYFFFLLVVGYWTVALGITPAWTSWMSGLVKGDKIRGFFSNRSIILSIGTLLGLAFAGVILKYVDDKVLGIDKYHFLFVVCFILRFFSFITLFFHQKVPFHKVQTFSLGKGTFRSDEKYKFVLKFIYFSCLIKIGVFFSASFFAPYMLKQLNFNYVEYMLILVSAFSGRMILGQILKKYLSKFDINLLYMFSAIGISFIPLFWTFSKDFTFIFLLEIFTGLFWGAFEISFLVTSFEEIPSEKQAEVMTFYNFIHTICIGIGTLLGGITFYYLGNSIHTYHMIFFTSGLLRLLSVAFFPRKRIVNGEVQVLNFMRTYAVRPNMGIIGRPMWTLVKKLKKNKEKNPN